MKKIITWIPIVIAGIILIWQEDLYFNTIWELKIGSLNIWEINRFLPSLILFAVLTGFYTLTLFFINKKKIQKSSFNSISLGTIAILSSLPIYLLLYINDSSANPKQEIVTYKITGFEMMSAGKRKEHYPSIFIDSGYPNKRISLKGYSKEFVYSKKEAMLTIRNGHFGWPVIDEIKLK
jgi:hypothetical protein